MKKTLFALLLTFSVSIGYGQVTIPYTNTAVSSSAFTSSSLSGTYGTPVAGVKFGALNDFGVIHYTTPVSYINFTIRGNVGTGPWSGTFDVLESQDGVTYSLLKRITSLSPVNSDKYYVVIPNINSQYIKFILSTKVSGSNVGLYKINILNSIPLPVELSNFIGEKNYLLWTTQSETQNKGWEVERSIDGKAWTNIGFVEGFGNSSQKLDYHFELKEFGKYYYRIKQIDFDGHFEYSPIEFLDNLNLFQEGKMYIDLSGRETTKPKANTMYIIPDGRKIMYIEK
jgi:hypothetical protein